MTIVLRTTSLCKTFGGITATDHVSLVLEKGARHALIGPNGAGKTTLINLLTGVLKPTSGSIELNGESITHLSNEARVKRGIARTFQINQLCADMTPLEMIMMVIGERRGNSAQLFSTLDNDAQTLRDAAEILERFQLADIMDETIATLPYGKQRQLEIAAAFALKPAVLLLDEPAAGVPESERRDLLASVAALPHDVSVFLIEHDMDIVFRFATTISVLVNGAILTEGTPATVAADVRVREAYLGALPHD